LVAGSNPAGRVPQTPENKELTKTDKTSEVGNQRNLAEILFLKLQNDPDLRLILERWPELSVDLKRAIVKMVT